MTNENVCTENSKIHYLLLVMSIERTIGMAQQLCDFGSLDAISCTKEIKKIHSNDPIFSYRLMMVATVSFTPFRYPFVNITRSNRISMSENYGRSNWKREKCPKRMKNKVKIKCTHFRAMVYRVQCVCPCGEKQRFYVLCNADTAHHHRTISTFHLVLPVWQKPNSSWLKSEHIQFQSYLNAPACKRGRWHKSIPSAHCKKNEHRIEIRPKKRNIAVATADM